MYLNFLTIKLITVLYYFSILMEKGASLQQFLTMYLWLRFYTKPSNNVFNVDNIAYTWALVSEQQSGLRISGSILKGWPLLGKDETSARAKKPSVSPVQRHTRVLTGLTFIDCSSFPFFPAPFLFSFSFFCSRTKIQT